MQIEGFEKPRRDAQPHYLENNECECIFTEELSDAATFLVWTIRNFPKPGIGYLQVDEQLLDKFH
ncbi:hypothetical protein [Arenibacter palladensis]|uniref:hypothetical protein n=1 Tax=Arenibacter palladensis TaxID=237373 RepID=UPI002FD3835D